MFEYINLINFIVIITFINGVYFLKKNKQIHNYLIIILVINLLTEITALLMLYNKLNITILYSISFILHNFFWLYLFLKNSKIKFSHFLILTSYIIFCFINIILIEKLELNYLTLILGALLYIISFIYESYFQLKEENLDFFKTNNYVLLFAPILFFLGMSFVFGFRNSSIRDIVIFRKTDLYTFIGYFVNVIYYSLINLYIYKERKLNG